MRLKNILLGLIFISVSAGTMPQATAATAEFPLETTPSDLIPDAPLIDVFACDPIGWVQRVSISDISPVTSCIMQE